jgi:DNA-binding protein HU-beta
VQGDQARTAARELHHNRARPNVRAATMKNMNKAELIEHIAGAHSLTKAEAGRIVGTFTSAIVNTVKKGGAVVIPGFGSFKQVARAARTGVNPSTGAKLKIAASKAPKFTPGSAFKAAVDPKAARRKADKAAAVKAAAPAKKAATKTAAAKKAAPAKKAGKGA